MLWLPLATRCGKIVDAAQFAALATRPERFAKHVVDLCGGSSGKRRPGTAQQLPLIPEIEEAFIDSTTPSARW